MRLTLNDDEVMELMKAISKSNYPLYNKIQKQYNDDISRDITKKQSSIQEATKHRTNAAKAKMLNAINILRLESQEITVSSISKMSGCSYNTVKKYYSKGSDYINSSIIVDFATKEANGIYNQAGGYMWKFVDADVPLNLFNYNE